MQAVMLDAATLGPEDLDFSHLQAAVDSLRCYQHTQPDEVRKAKHFGKHAKDDPWIAICRVVEVPGYAWCNTTCVLPK